MNKLSPSGMIGLAMLAVFVIVGVLGPLIAPYDPSQIDLLHGFAPMGGEHWLGTDSNGADALSQLLWGAREALIFSLGVVSASALIGFTLGIVAGYFGGWIDELVMRIVDVLLAFPGLLLNIAIVAVVKRPGLGLVMAALIANGWVGYARVARGQVLALRERDFVLAARAVGASNRRIMRRHIAPNLLGPLLVQMSFSFGTVILVEATLSFLGLGPQIDYTWGAMLSQGRAFLGHAGFLHYALAPGFAIMWVVLAANLAGDGLRDRYDPQQRGR
ncbi:MAG: ABC transporter permease [Deltaproteobacteria bacterium]|nr:ABC transporter permease [Deltaproteobacteria bacterium]